MAKARPTASLEEMESEVGFHASMLTHICREDGSEWYYSDLRPVSQSPQEHFARELDAHRLSRGSDRDRSFSALETAHQKARSLLLIETQHLQVHLSRKSAVGYYQFVAEIYFVGGFKMTLLLMNRETRILLRNSNVENPRAETPTTFAVAAELRQAIYSLILGDQPRVDLDHPIWDDTAHLLRGLSDPSGRTYAVPSSSLLQVNRQVRDEALPVAYQLLHIEPVGIDESVRLLMAMGEVGRANLRSMSCLWESESEAPGLVASSACDDDDPTCVLPRLHVSRLGHLLRQCRQLAHLRLYFEEDHLRGRSLEALKADPGIRELCSVRPSSTVAVFDMGLQPLDYDDFVHWLRDQMLGSRA